VNPLKLRARAFAAIGVAATLAFALSCRFALPACAQATAPLSDYVGKYADHPDDVEVVAGDRLLAVQAEAEYPLQRVDGDIFKLTIGEELVFKRDAAGSVTGYEIRGAFHRRISREVSPEPEALLRPRPGAAGVPANYRYRAPADLGDGIAVGRISGSALSESVAAKIVGGVLDGTWLGVHSVLLYQRGHLVLEEYFYGYDVNRQQQLRSATKSVVSALAGIAIDRGDIRGVGTAVAPLLNYASYANPDPRKAEITIGNFLSMSSGLACNDHSSDSPGRELVIDETPDWVKATMDLPIINDPGKVGYYCSGGVAVVGRVVENATHQKLPDFAQENLFAPLGVKRSDWKWNYTLTNEDKEYSQIHLRPRDMLKLGILYANGGTWGGDGEGQPVVSKGWVAASLAKQSSVDNTDYGYFWWRPWLNVEMPEGAQKIYMSAAQGNGGQKIYIVPEFDLVAVFTGGDYNADGTPPNKIMAQVVLPALISAKAH
jgi:CubicO group peptidase (beta-lactamase class C family)